MTKHEEERKGCQLPEKLVACERSPIPGGEGCTLASFEEVPASLPKKLARGTESPLSSCNDVVLCFHK